MATRWPAVRARRGDPGRQHHLSRDNHRLFDQRVYPTFAVESFNVRVTFPGRTNKTFTVNHLGHKAPQIRAVLRRRLAGTEIDL